MFFADIILPLPLEGTFTYSIPTQLEDTLQVGFRVQVPWGAKKTYIGIVDEIHQQTPPANITIKPISRIIDNYPVVTNQQLKLWHWISNYYLAPIGDVMNAALAAGLKSEEHCKPKTETCVKLNPELHDHQNLDTALNILKRAQKQEEMFRTFLQITTPSSPSISSVPSITKDELLNASHGNTATLRQLINRHILLQFEREISPADSPHVPGISSETFPSSHLPEKLTPPQQDAYNSILMQFLKKNVVLLHGVTSSGKTEIYIQLIQRAIEHHQQVLFLMPEIALTVQMQQRLQSVFQERIGIYHSKYSDRDRLNIWQKQLSKTPYDIILGARSALFLPFNNLGLVIIDEEHETSYKQQDPAPRYHARSAAIMLAHFANAKTLLGTATPSAETHYNTLYPQQNPKYGLVKLTQRYKDIQLPEINVIDLQDYRHRKMMYASFSAPLLHAMRQAVENKQQVIIFQNRRGYSRQIQCNNCGWTPRCTQCDVTLTWHKTTNQLTCHYCGHTFPLPPQCPACQEKDYRHSGIGTEKIEDQVLHYIPQARIARMDFDTTRTRSAYERLIDDFSTGKTNILIGTQMVTKGLNFRNVAVVGIINADTHLNSPDFRAYEHTFTMLTQVAGRSGRHKQRGTVFLQTTQPQLPVIQQIADNDYTSFYNNLLLERQLYNYPPYTHIIYVLLKHKNSNTVSTAAIEMTSRLKQQLASRVLGPETPPVSLVKSLNIRRIIIKAENNISLTKLKEYLRQCHKELLKNSKYKTLTLYYDIDP
ncbi:MAG: primosomal protein N' [Bacteroidaceae bacterium]|nr:primosomal protein N' [Bacteroidaceae bacterium]